MWRKTLNRKRTWCSLAILDCLYLCNSACKLTEGILWSMIPYQERKIVFFFRFRALELKRAIHKLKQPCFLPLIVGDNRRDISIPINSFWIRLRSFKSFQLLKIESLFSCVLVVGGEENHLPDFFILFLVLRAVVTKLKVVKALSWSVCWTCFRLAWSSDLRNRKRKPKAGILTKKKRIFSDLFSRDVYSTKKPAR